MNRLVEVALKEVGVKEILGSSHNPRILEYHATTGGFSDDETAWCSSFVNWCAIQAGVKHTNKPNARSWLNIGVPVAEPELGDIAIFKRGNSDWQGHVTIFISKVGNLVYGLGGNQGNMVTVSPYNEADILGYRRLP